VSKLHHLYDGDRKGEEEMGSRTNQEITEEEEDTEMEEVEEREEMDKEEDMEEKTEKRRLRGREGII
jgi:hypothetical protein